MMKRQNLGPYLMGIAIGIFIGVGQMVTIGRHVWWWGSALSGVALVLLMVGFECLDSSNPRGDDIPAG